MDKGVTIAGFPKNQEGLIKIIFIGLTILFLRKIVWKTK